MIDWQDSNEKELNGSQISEMDNQANDRDVIFKEANGIVGPIHCGVCQGLFQKVSGLNEALWLRMNCLREMQCSLAKRNSDATEFSRQNRAWFSFLRFILKKEEC